MQSREPDRIKHMGIGVTIIGIEMLRRSYMEETVTYVEVH